LKIRDLDIVNLSLKSCPVGLELHPSVDALSSPGYCSQGHELLLALPYKGRDIVLRIIIEYIVTSRDFTP
jgi:hypothetical protein